MFKFIPFWQTVVQLYQLRLRMYWWPLSIQHSSLSKANIAAILVNFFNPDAQRLNDEVLKKPLRNPMVLPFKWIPLSSIFTWYYCISSNNSHPLFNSLRQIITSLWRIGLKWSPPPHPTPTGYPLGIPIVVDLEGEAKVESDPAKLISNNLGSDAEDMDIENSSREHIWNTLNANVQFIWCD